MKKSILMLVLLTVGIPASVSASDLIHFRDTTTSWEVIKTIAAKENKLIFIDAYTDWCSWCKVMDRETFSDKVVADFMNERFVPVHYEMETGFGARMAAKYRVNAFPTFLIFTPEGNLVNRIVGFHKPKEFFEKLAMALESSHHDNLTGISPVLDPGFPNFYLDSFLKGDLRKRPDSATVNTFLASAKDLSDEVSWSVIYRFSSLVTEKYKTFFYQNYDRLKKMYGANDVETAAGSFLNSDLAAATRANDEAALEKVIAAAQKYTDEPGGEKRLSYRMRFYSGSNRWKAFADLVDSLRDSNGSLDPNAANSYSWSIYERCDDKDVVARATQWMSEAIVKSPTYMLLDTYAALLYKSGDLKKAKEYAELAIETGKKEKEQVNETEALLGKINLSLQKKQ